MKAFLRFGFTLLIPVLLSGCLSWYREYEPFSVAQKYPSKPSKYVMPCSTGTPIGRKYEKIGLVAATAYTYPGAEKQMQIKARQVGADAVMQVRYTTYNMSMSYAMSSYSGGGVIHQNGFYTSYGTASGLGVTTPVTYPKVMGIAIRFLDGIDKPVEFTNPNIVDDRPQNQK